MVRVSCCTISVTRLELHAITSGARPTSSLAKIRCRGTGYRCSVSRSLCRLGLLVGFSEGDVTRDQHADLFTGIILEGPNKWTVRPVAEFFYEEEFGQAHTVSALVG